MQFYIIAIVHWIKIERQLYPIYFHKNANITNVVYYEKIWLCNQIQRPLFQSKLFAFSCFLAKYEEECHLLKSEKELR